MEPVRAILKRNPRSTVEAFVPAYCMPEPPKHARDVEVGIMPTSSGRADRTQGRHCLAPFPHGLAATLLASHSHTRKFELPGLRSPVPVITPALRVLPGLVRRIDIQVSSVSGVNRNVVLYAFGANQTIVATAANHIGGVQRPSAPTKLSPYENRSSG